jgi:hypothetical protein
MSRFLCRIGLHRWVTFGSGSIVYCSRCKKRVW